MALSQIGPNDSGAPFNEKVNAAIVEADKVAGLAAILALLQIQLAPYIDLVGGTPNRPGDSRTLFTRIMTGSPKARPAIDKGTVENGGELGQVLRISGADTDPVLGYIDVAPRRAYYMRPGRAYLVRHAFARSQDPNDPANNAVELRFQNLSSTFGVVSDVRFGDPYVPTIASGARFVDTFIGKAGAPGANTYTVPATSRYGVPYFRIYGNGHQTDLGEVWLYDVTDTLAGGADIASLLARVATLERSQGQSQGAGIIQRSTWSSGGSADTALSLVAPILTTIGRVPDTDTGSHAGVSTEVGYGVPGPGLVPNAGEYAPTGSPLAWRRTGDTTAKAAATALLANAVVKTTIADTDFVMIPNADRAGTSLITFANFFAALEAKTVEKFIPNAADADVGTSPVILIPADAERNSVEIINTSETSGLLIGFDTPPVKGQKNTIRLPAGGTAAYSARYPRRGTIYAASESETIPVNAFYTNRSGIDVVADGVVAAFFAKVNSANYSNAERDATSTLIKELRINGNPLARMGSAYILAAPDSQSAAQDLVRPRTLSRFGGPAYTPRKGWTGNGTDQYLSMNYIPRTAPEFKLNDHSLGICVDAAVIPSGPYSMGISTAAIQANRNATGAAMRSGGTTTNVLTVAGRGGMFALSRATPTGYRAFRDEIGQDVVQASDTLGTSDLDMLILAQNNASGPNGFSTLTPYFVWVGSSMTDEQLITISRATAKFKAALDAIV